MQDEKKIAFIIYLELPSQPGGDTLSLGFQDFLTHFGGEIERRITFTF
jgi:hypothetical protein